MISYWLRRLLEAIPLLFAVSVAVFVVFRLAPGDPVALLVDPTLITPAERQAILAELGLNDPPPVQYVKMMTALAQGQLRSFKSKQPTYEIVGDAFPVTLVVTLLGLGLAVLVALPLGTLAARRPGGPVDRALSISMSASLAFPTFLFALLLLRLFTEEWRLLPGSGIAPRGTVGLDPVASLPYLVMPTVVTALTPTTIFARYLRDALQDVLSEDYIRTARAKGLADATVMTRHAIRNALLPMVGLLSTIVPVTLGGAVIVETIFGLPGLGRATVSAALGRDYPVVMTTVLFSALLVVVSNLFADMLYGALDPRIRFQ